MTVGASVMIWSPDVIEKSKIIMISQLAQCSKYFIVQRKKKVRVRVCVCVCPREEGTELVSVRVWEKKKR